jgi:lysophospholipase L1-like esterase
MRFIKTPLSRWLIIYVLLSAPLTVEFSLNEQFRFAFFQHLAHLFSKVSDNTIVFAGDSLTSGGRSWTNIAGTSMINHINLSGNGLTSWQILKFAEKINYYNPKYVFVTAGTNDVFAIKENQYQKEVFKRNYTEMIRTFKKDQRKIVVTLIPYQWTKEHALLIDSLNTEIIQIATEQGVKYIDINPLISKDKTIQPHFTTDGVHLTSDAYKVWKQELSKVISP